MTTKRQRFKVGDHVAERPRPRFSYATTPQGRAASKDFLSQRYGTIVAIVHRRARDKRIVRYLLIKWDHLCTPTHHAQACICHIHEYQELVKQTFHAIDA